MPLDINMCSWPITSMRVCNMMVFISFAFTTVSMSCITIPSGVFSDRYPIPLHPSSSQVPIYTSLSLSHKMCRTWILLWRMFLVLWPTLKIMINYWNWLLVGNWPPLTNSRILLGLSLWVGYSRMGPYPFSEIIHFNFACHNKLWLINKYVNKNSWDCSRERYFPRFIARTACASFVLHLSMQQQQKYTKLN